MKTMRLISSANLHVLVIATALLASPAANAAVTYKWTGTADGNWQTTANWDSVVGKPPSGSVTTSDDTLSVANGGNHPLVYTEAENRTSVNVFQISNGELTINGGTLVLTNSNKTVSGIGDFNTGGKLSINGGLVLFETWDTLYINPKFQR